MTQSYDLKWRIQGHKICDWDILSLPRSQFPAYGQWVLAEDLWGLCLSWRQNLVPGARCLTLRRAGLLWVDKKTEQELLPGDLGLRWECLSLLWPISLSTM